MSWAFLSDLHFIKSELKRLKPTTDWILEQLRLNKSLRHVFILGDTLHTRNDVNVEALSTAAEFVRQLSMLATKPKIHMLVGNHDMYFLQSRSISSLDAFDLEPESEELKRRNSLDELEKKLLEDRKGTRKTIRVYKEITEVEIDRTPIVFIPFHEDQTIIRTYLLNYIATNPAPKVSNTIIMGHLALNGCMINGYSEFTNVVKNVKGDLSVTEFLHFKRTFTGHYHHHRTYAGRVTYVGAPRQMNYGDCGDTNRGFITYSPITNDFALSVNPHGNFYIGINLQDLRVLRERPPTEEIANRYKNKFVRINLPPENEYTNEEVHGLIRKLKLGYKICGHRQFGTKSVLEEKEKAVVEDVEIMDDGYKMKNVRDLFQQYMDQVKVPSHVLKNENEDCQIENLDEREAEWTARKAMKVAHWKRLIVSIMNQIMDNVDGIRDDESVASDDDCSEMASSCASSSGAGPEIGFFDATIDSIEISNFLGISGYMKINLNQLEPGIWFILGLNGTGKSTILEAICWCLYGKVLRKDLSVQGVINDYISKNEKCSVKIIFKNGYAIKREREERHNSPHHLMLIEPDGMIIEKGTLGDTENEVVTLLGIDYETFTQSSILSSAATSNFINGLAGDQRLIIEKLLGFARFEKYETKAKLFAKDFENCQTALDSRLRTLQIQLDSSREKDDSYKTQQTAYQTQIVELKAKLAQQRKSLDQLRLQFQQSAELNKDYDQQLQQCTVIIEQLLPEQMKCQEQIQKLMNEQVLLSNYTQAVNKFNQLKSEAQQMQQEQSMSVKGSVIENVLVNLLEIANLVADDVRKKLYTGSILPLQSYMKTTGLNHREISQLKLHNAIVAMSVKVEEQQSAVQTAKSKVPLLADEKNSPEQIGAALANSVTEIQNKLKTVCNELAACKALKLKLEKQGRPVKRDEDLQAAIQEAVLTINSLESKIEVITNEAARREDNSPQIKALESQIKDLQERQLTAARLRLEAGQFCVEALVGTSRATQAQSNGFRTYCLKQQIVLLNKLLALNMRVMNEDALGSMNQDLSCRLTEGLKLVEDKHGIAMGKRSDGQRRRGQLALFFTFFTIAQRRSPFQAGFLFLDEPFDALDEAGHYAVQKWITHLWNQPNNPLRHIFIITHGNHITPEARGFITAELNPNCGSRYVAFSHRDLHTALENVFEYPIEEEVVKERKRKALPRKKTTLSKAGVKKKKVAVDSSIMEMDDDVSISDT